MVQLTNFHRVNRLPDQFESNSVYFLKGEHEHDMEMHVIGDDPNEPLRVMTAKDVLAMMIQRLSSIMQIVVVAPITTLELYDHKSIYQPRVSHTAKGYYIAGNQGRRFQHMGGHSVIDRFTLPREEPLRQIEW